VFGGVGDDALGFVQSMPLLYQDGGRL